MTDTITLPTDRTAALRDTARAALRRCGADADRLPGAGRIPVVSPVTGEALVTVPLADSADVEAAVERAHAAFRQWRKVPAPVRGRLVKRFGELLAEHKEPLADLVGVEVGKIRSEALGEVQEMIDICDLAVGLSRQLEGRTMPSERPGHRLMETWHPLGVVAVISAFNFPVAVWAWNAAIAVVCGDTVVWKPSERTPLTAVAASALLDRAAREEGAPEGLNTVVVADAEGAGALVDSRLVPLVSA
ncbi:MAG: aldehyde dehydrogenase, partial [Pseudonocardia sp.]|nr:aldehyde dehydrogenase [Pseudonocardia sp.]